MRIAHIAAGLGTAGGELFLERLIHSLGDEKFEQHVISMLDAGSVGARMQACGIDVLPLGCRGKVGALRGVFRLGGLLKRLQPDVVQGWMYHGNLAAWAGLRLAWVQCPLLWSVRHSLDRWEEEGLFWRSEIRLTGRLGGSPQRIVFNSSRSARQHERLGYPRAKACVIPNGFDVERFSPNAVSCAETRRQLQLGDDAVVLGMLGRYHPLKGHENFLRAASIVSREVPAARFVLAGRGVAFANQQLMRLVSELGLDSRVALLDEREDVPDVMNALDIYVSSSSSEAFPNAVGEAMSCGVPCVVTDAGDSAELVGDAGIVIPVKSPERLAAGILELIRAGAERRRALGMAGRARIRENYSMTRVAQQYADLYRSVCRIA